MSCGSGGPSRVPEFVTRPAATPLFHLCSLRRQQSRFASPRLAPDLNPSIYHSIHQSNLLHFASFASHRSPIDLTSFSLGYVRTAFFRAPDQPKRRSIPIQKARPSTDPRRTETRRHGHWNEERVSAASERGRASPSSTHARSTAGKARRLASLALEQALEQALERVSVCEGACLLPTQERKDPRNPFLLPLLLLLLLLPFQLRQRSECRPITAILFASFASESSRTALEDPAPPVTNEETKKQRNKQSHLA